MLPFNDVIRKFTHVRSFPSARSPGVSCGDEEHIDMQGILWDPKLAVTPKRRLNRFWTGHSAPRCFRSLNIPPFVRLYRQMPEINRSHDDKIPRGSSTHCNIAARLHGEQHDDVIKWKKFPRYWPFVRVIHRSPVNSPHKGQWRRALVLSLICVWINGWENNREAGDLRRYRSHYDVIVTIRGFFN